MKSVMKSMMITIKHIYQPTANTCGPACLYMVLKYLVNRTGLGLDAEIKYTVNDLAIICGTDWEVGTPPDRMEKGMKALDIKYVEYINSPSPFELLQSVIDSGNIPILRTITKGAPHWIIVDDYTIYQNDGMVLYNVLDPWLGEIKYSERDLVDVWGIRDYQFFEVIVPPHLRYDVTNVDEDFYL